jgi:hypothetical protein
MTVDTVYRHHHRTPFCQANRPHPSWILRSKDTPQKKDGSGNRTVGTDSATAFRVLFASGEAARSALGYVKKTLCLYSLPSISTATDRPPVVNPPTVLIPIKKILATLRQGMRPRDLLRFFCSILDSYHVEFPRPVQIDSCAHVLQLVRTPIRVLFQSPCDLSYVRDLQISVEPSTVVG